MNYTAKGNTWVALHDNGVVGPYFFNNDTGRGANYYYMLDTYVQLKAQQFSHNSSLQHYGPPPHTRFAIRSFLN